MGVRAEARVGLAVWGWTRRGGTLCMACSSCGKPAKGAAVLATLTMGAGAAASSARPCSLPTRPGRRHLVRVRVRVRFRVRARVRASPS